MRLAPGTVIGHLGGVEGSRGARRFGVDGYVVFAPAAHQPPAASSPIAHRLGSAPGRVARVAGELVLGESDD